MSQVAIIQSKPRRQVVVHFGPPRVVPMGILPDLLASDETVATATFNNLIQRRIAQHKGLRWTAAQFLHNDPELKAANSMSRAAMVSYERSEDRQDKDEALNRFTMATRRLPAIVVYQVEYARLLQKEDKQEEADEIFHHAMASIHGPRKVLWSASWHLCKERFTMCLEVLQPLLQLRRACILYPAHLIIIYACKRQQISNPDIPVGEESLISLRFLFKNLPLNDRRWTGVDYIACELGLSDVCPGLYPTNRHPWITTGFLLHDCLKQIRQYKEARSVLWTVQRHAGMAARALMMLPLKEVANVSRQLFKSIAALAAKKKEADSSSDLRRQAAPEGALDDVEGKTDDGASEKAVDEIWSPRKLISSEI